MTVISVPAMVLNLLVWEWFFLIGGSIGRSSTPPPPNPKRSLAAAGLDSTQPDPHQSTCVSSLPTAHRERDDSLASRAASAKAPPPPPPPGRPPLPRGTDGVPDGSGVRQAAALTAATPAPALIRTAAAPPGQRVHQRSSSPCCPEALPADYSL
ncbi:wiskott-Aldrich syndrome protein family member 2 [Setaria italica]|uniref:wiskott-Aldrich syndrome protein family member 2 n=1 Tax=Setaria italica TaxID=4555 RepID=UPI000719A004|nr:wiskott-Aldrich syndrome protein family member 2 [Setaria italica]